MRLIDANRLMDSLRGNLLIDVTTELEKTIVEQPTAFDKDKVIAELSTLRQAEYDDSDEEPEFTDVDDALEEGQSQGRYQAYFKAIEVVEKGGVE